MKTLKNLLLGALALAVVAGGSVAVASFYANSSFSGFATGQTFGLVDAGGNVASLPQTATAGVFTAAATVGFATDAVSYSGSSAVTWICEVSNPTSTVSSGYLVPLCSQDDVHFAPLSVATGPLSSIVTPDAGWSNASSATVSTSTLMVAIPPGQACNFVAIGVGVSYTDGGTIACQFASAIRQ